MFFPFSNSSDRSYCDLSLKKWKRLFLCKVITKKVSLLLSLTDSCQQVVMRSAYKLALKAAWQIAANEQLPNVSVWYSQQAGLGVLCLWIVDLSWNMLLKKGKSFCPFTSWRKHHGGKSRGEKVSQTFKN